jgi:hypothetical protein
VPARLALLAAAVLCGAALPAASAAQGAARASVLPRTSTTILLVVPADAGLGGAAAVSAERRDRLARALRHAGVSAVVATDTRAAAALGQVLADSVLRVERTPCDRGVDAPDPFAGWLLANVLLGREGQTVVLVAERPLASALVRRATGVALDLAAPSDRDELLVLTVAPDRSGLVRASM